MHLARFASRHALVAACLLALAAPASAAIYNDSVGEQAGSGDSEVDIRNVEVTNNATNINFKITLVGDIAAANFGNYHIGFDTVPGGKTTTGVAWGNPFGMSSGMDYWLGSWVNFGGGSELHQYTGDGTNNNWGPTIPGTTVTLDQFSTTISIPLAAMALVDGSVIKFDVYSTYGSPGGQSAYDASSNPNLTVAAPWNGTPYDSGQLVSTYTVVVPEPMSIGACTAMATIAVASRRRRQRS
jgi:hypothetical protein